MAVDGRLRVNRRTALKRVSALSVVGIAGMAGCVGEDEEEDDDPVEEDDDVDDDVDDDEAEEPADDPADADVAITFASTFEPGHIQIEAARRFADNLEEYSDGEMVVEELSPGGAYGSADEIADLCRDGVIDMHVTGPLTVNNYVPEYYMLQTPFYVESPEHYRGLVWSPDVQGLWEGMIETGNQIFIGHPIHRGWRMFTSNDPVGHPDDAQEYDINLRLPEIDVWVDVWTEIGVDADPVALDELYSALETGVVNASEGDISQILSFSLYEVQDYLSDTNHVYGAGDFHLNWDLWQSLDDTQKEVFEEAAYDACLETHEESLEMEEETIEETIDAGMEFVEADQDAFLEAGLPAVEELFEERYTGDWDDWLADELEDPVRLLEAEEMIDM